MEMRPAIRFSLLMFAPLYVAFLSATLLLLPTSALLTLIGLLDATASLTESVGYGIWALGPLLAALGLLLVGIRLHPLYARGRSHPAAWVVVWAAFSTALFVATWFGTTIMTSIGASDYATGEFLRWTATVAALTTLVLQPGVGLWLYVSSRLLRRMEPVHAVER